MKISTKVLKAIEESAEIESGASFLTHSLYRYPASMSPYIAKSIIHEFTKPGDLILDPFCGGGTTAVEALSQGRKAICSDVNTLACFVTAAKAYPLRASHLNRAEAWLVEAYGMLMKEKVKKSHYEKYSPFGTSPRTFSMVMKLRDLAMELKPPPLRNFVLLLVLKAAKSCFDCKDSPVRPDDLLRLYKNILVKYISKAREYSNSCSFWNIGQGHGDIRICHSDASSLRTLLSEDKNRIRLVLTSPPYPGIHILYNRWQLHGRKEIDLPYQILGLSDGLPTSRYTMGDRKENGNRSYFSSIAQSFTGIRDSISKRAVVAQVVSFSDPRRQLPEYLSIMRESGFVELKNRRHGSPFITRKVPRRKWYNSISNSVESIIEFVLFHKPR